MLNQKRGFTLLEMLVAITASTIVVGGFLIAFSSLDAVGRNADQEIRSASRANNVRMMISKLLSGASQVEFKRITVSGNTFDVLYYYRYEYDVATSTEKLVEYGYFYGDKELSTDPNFRQEVDASGATIEHKNLYFNRVVGTDLPKPDVGGSASNPDNFDYRSTSRFVVMQDVKDFYASVTQADTRQGTDAVSDRLQRFNIDYQITTAYGTGPAVTAATQEVRETIFKGSSYSVGRVTEGS